MQTRWFPAFVSALVLGASQAGAAPAPVGLAGSHVADQAFELTLRAVGTYQAGHAAKAEIVLVAKSGYKVNDKYPTKFRFSGSNQVKPAGEVVGKDAFRVEGHQGVMTLNFTPDAAGKKTLAGELKFSVCTSDRCLVEKRELALTLTVN